MLTVGAAVLASCFQPTTGADVIEPGTQPPGSLFGADAGSGGPCGGADPSPLSQLHVRVRTSAFGGRYAPRNVGAIWIEDAHGKFVKTLERWGKNRARYLTRFTTASSGNVVDAVTSATMSQHTTHNREWDLTDLTTCEVPTGDYDVVVEHTDFNGTGPTIKLPFTIGSAPSTTTLPEATNFHDLLIELR